MEDNRPIESYLRQLLTQIVTEAVDNAMARYSYKEQDKHLFSPEIMNLKAVSEYLGISKSVIYSYTHKRLIPHYKVGKRLYFRKVDLEQWVIGGKKMTITEIQEEARNYLSKQRKGEG